MKKFDLYTRDSAPIPVAADRIVCNDVVFEGEPGSRMTRLWICFNEFGPMGAVWANGEEDALDELVDQDLAGGILIDENKAKNLTEEDEEHVARLGNHGEPCDLSNCAVSPVEFKPSRDWRLMVKLAEARGAGHDNLDF